eukprot:TRINITY_DN1940_c0_g1_i1.p1 TRINITY_DN1940_c0_g1~~TRINITY_DN1940_c0_g1_i1.p1  ORF type:complete len:708 (+),score=164.83 TRINITY_DN1940_c0_g1_i1:55-2124(+)
MSRRSRYVLKKKPPPAPVDEKAQDGDIELALEGKDEVADRRVEEGKEERKVKYQKRFVIESESEILEKMKEQISVAQQGDEDGDEAKLNMGVKKNLRIQLTNLPLDMDRDELMEVFKDVLQREIVASFVIMQGGTYTGRGWVELENEEDCLFALAKMEGYEIRGKKIKTFLPKKSTFQRHQKQKNKRNNSKIIIPHSGELNRLTRRFGNDILKNVEDFTFEIHLEVPPNEYNVEYLLLGFSVPMEYPDENVEIKVLNEEIPEHKTLDIEESIIKRLTEAYDKKANQIFGIIVWIMNQRKIIMKKVKDAPTVANIQKPIEVVPKPKKETKTQETITVVQQDEETSESNEVNNPVDNEDEETSESNEMNNPVDNEGAGITNHTGIQIFNDNLIMENISLMECVSLQLEIRCLRCQFRQVEHLVPREEFNGTCKKCHAPFIITFRPDLIHEFRHVLGYIDRDNTAPFDVLPSELKVTCYECAESLIFDGVTHGQRTEENCHSCHSKLSISSDPWKFRKIRKVRNLTDEERARINQTKKRKEERKELGIQGGKPLPDYGTCSHYKKSQRWLRFPCCGRAFPCDKCHEEASPTGHIPQRANRMLCGHCSHEQLFTTKDVCSSCNKNLTGIVKTAFWEGGKGQRDKTKMSKDDTRKYSGQNKTISLIELTGDYLDPDPTPNCCLQNMFVQAATKI